MVMPLQQAFDAAFSLHKQGRIAQADQAYRRILQTHPDHLGALQLGGAAALQLRQYPRALDLLSRAIQQDPTDPSLFNNRGLVRHNLGQTPEALSDFDHALSLHPNYAEAFNNKGTALRKAGRDREALACFQNAIRLRPPFFDALVNQGHVLCQMDDHASALLSYQRALQLQPQHAPTLVCQGDCCTKLGQVEEALALYEKAKKIQPNDIGTWLKVADLHRTAGRMSKALDEVHSALKQCPDQAEAHNYIGNLYHALGDDLQAVQHHQRAMALNPGFPDPKVHLGQALTSLGQLPEACAAYEAAWQQQPDRPYLLGTWIHSQMKLCQWAGVEDRIHHLATALNEGHPVANPFITMSLIDAPDTQCQAARRYFLDKHATQVPPPPFPKRGTGERARIGYVSADFKDHAVSYLTQDLYTLHDRGQFEVHGFSLKKPKETEFHKNLVSRFDHFHDLSDMSDAEACRFIRDQQIDIAVDLGGYTLDSRPSLFAMRCAPIQVNHLGFPGTTGSTVHDYIVGDRIVTPLDDAQHFSEAIIQLPHSFQVNPVSRPRPDHPITRADAGLPPHAFVYCAFNNPYKILPNVFARWMRILHGTPDSVLWLYADHPQTQDNLRQAAAFQGIDASRLVFARQVPYAEYVQRYELADLFLDTHPYNAGTTASDALWAGLPVLTLKGQSFVSRMAASLLSAVGLAELITESASAYEQLAIDLAHNPSRLSSMKAHLLSKRADLSLFATQAWVRHMELAYRQALATCHAGKPPQHIQVPDTGVSNA
jgi:predicted O-linked N-acetylglucosamine transferase (SPINDLY family)